MKEKKEKGKRSYYHPSAAAIRPKKREGEGAWFVGLVWVFLCDGKERRYSQYVVRRKRSEKKKGGADPARPGPLASSKKQRKGRPQLPRLAHVGKETCLSRQQKEKETAASLCGYQRSEKGRRGNAGGQGRARGSMEKKKGEKRGGEPSDCAREQKGKGRKSA